MTSNREECLDALQEAVDELGHAPTVEEYKTLDISPSYNTIALHCGGWTAAIEELGEEPSTGSQYTEQDCLDALQEAADQLGEEPSMWQYDRLDLRPSSSTITHTFGTWNEAKVEAGVRPED
ncbi:homing endonuclease associated repeat-containing protein [Halobacterium wangiae]|uniref:homing endonuclease associated repeat-containing protein n=1 Tax=Halobacterium wangiae TaxID=2902623 RepID=UPI001E5CDDC8|nr:hypothetical protein [Halobacterium wangiae]